MQSFPSYAAEVCDSCDGDGVGSPELPVLPFGDGDVRTVVSYDVVMPERRVRSFGSTPKATLTVLTERHGSYELKLPVKVARRLKADTFELPANAEEFFSALAVFEQGVCDEALVAVLERREHSRLEARRKLERMGFLPEYVEAALDRACERKFISDERFASFFIEEKKRTRWGKRRIERELSLRGVDVAELPGYPEAFFEGDEEEVRAREALARKGVPDARPFEKLVKYLMGKGFDYPLAVRIVRERLDEEGL